MTAKELAEVLQDLPEDFPVKVIMDGEIDAFPSFNVDDDCIYLEGVSPSSAAKNAADAQMIMNFFRNY